jgi:hypothetical protein
MILLIKVAPQILKDFTKLLVEHDFSFEMNTQHRNFRIKGLSQIMLNTNTECYSLTQKEIKFHIDSVIHKNNIEEICIAEEDK